MFLKKINLKIFHKMLHSSSLFTLPTDSVFIHEFVFEKDKYEHFSLDDLPSIKRTTWVVHANEFESMTV